MKANFKIKLRSGVFVLGCGGGGKEALRLLSCFVEDQNVDIHSCLKSFKVKVISTILKGDVCI